MDIGGARKLAAVEPDREPSAGVELDPPASAPSTSKSSEASRAHVPVPCRPDDVVEVRNLRFPSQNLARLIGSSDEPRRIARARRRDFERNLSARNARGALDHFHD